MVSLDNLETIWVLAALVAATSAKAGWGPALRTGICTAFAVLSKETAIIFLPVIIWVLWQLRGDARRRSGRRCPAGRDGPAQAVIAVRRGTAPSVRCR